MCSSSLSGTFFRLFSHDCSVLLESLGSVIVVPNIIPFKD